MLKFEWNTTIKKEFVQTVWTTTKNLLLEDPSIISSLQLQQRTFEERGSVLAPTTHETKHSQPQHNISFPNYNTKVKKFGVEAKLASKCKAINIPWNYDLGIFVHCLGKLVSICLTTHCALKNQNVLCALQMKATELVGNISWAGATEFELEVISDEDCIGSQLYKGFLKFCSCCNVLNWKWLMMPVLTSTELLLYLLNSMLYETATLIAFSFKFLAGFKQIPHFKHLPN